MKRLFAALVVVGVPLSAMAFERASQADYETLSFCYGLQAGAASAFYEEHALWQKAYPNPDAEMDAMIGAVLAQSVQMDELASMTAALYEDLDHPGYEMDWEPANEAYFKGYSFWEAYSALDLDARINVPLSEDNMGMSADCWQVIFKLEGINANNAAAGLLVWE